jgi:glycosyltransferase involved in cell wall biosynthesis
MINPSAPDFANTPASAGRPHHGYSPLGEPAAPVVSIITSMPTTGEQIQAIAQTILGQSLQQWEWLIACPQDLATTVRTELAAGGTLDARIRILGGQSTSVAAGRNAGTRAARAPFVIFVDCGDLLEPSALEKMLWFLVSNPEYAFVASHFIVLDSPPRLEYSGFHDAGKFFESRLRPHHALIRRETFTHVGTLDESMGACEAEWDFWRRCAKNGLWGSTVKEFLVWQSVAAGSNGNAGPLQAEVPNLQPRWHMPYDPVPNDLPLANRLKETGPRALLLLPWLGWGGADKFNLDLVEQLVRYHGYRVTIATTNSSDHSRMPLFADFTPDIFLLQNFLRLVDYPRFIRYLIESRSIDVVILSNNHLSYQLLPYLRAHCPQPAYVDYCHVEDIHWQNGGHARSSVSYQILLDLVVVASNHLKQWMIERGADPNRIEVCHINVDPQRWAPAPHIRQRVRRDLSISDDVPVILFAGRLYDVKQPQVLGEVARQLHEKAVEFVMLVAGDGEDRAALEKFVRDNALSATVRLLGAMPYARMHELMCASDIFFLPSKWEGIALSLYEAMSCELAVVSADVGGQRELVTPDCGVLLPRADETSEATKYTAALEQLLRDPQRRIALGQQARRRIVEHFPLDRMGRRMVELFQRARELHRTQPRETPSRAFGLACATEAIEFTRLSGVADWLWQQRHSQASSTAEAGKPTEANGNNIWTRLGLRVIPRKRARRADHVAQQG